MKKLGARSIEDIRLDRVKVYAVATVDAAIGPLISETAIKLMDDGDTYARRHILRAFGKSETWKLRSPQTWWQHLKHDLRRRWPRLFGWLRVRYEEVMFDSGWVEPELSARLQAAKHVVIPYVCPPALRTFRA